MEIYQHGQEENIEDEKQEETLDVEACQTKLEKMCRDKKTPEELVQAFRDFSLCKVMRPPLFITGTKNMSSIQQMLRENRQAMAIVVDEYSGTDGLLTTSDIAREIFGPNYYGSADEIPENKDSFSVNGSVRLIDIKESLHIPITSEINQTLGGWMTEKLGYIPGLSEFVEFADYKFTVTQMTGNYINRIQVQKLSESQNE